jgi:type IV secretory pathway protease TraF
MKLMSGAIAAAWAAAAAVAAAAAAAAAGRGHASTCFIMSVPIGSLFIQIRPLDLPCNGRRVVQTEPHDVIL